MVVATDNVRESRVDIINDDSEIVGQRAPRSRNDQVIALGVFEHHRASYLVVVDDRTLQRISEAQNRIDTHAGIRAIATPAVIADFSTTGHLLCSPLVEFFPGAIATIGFAIVKPLIGNLPITIKSLRMEERTFVRVKPQPLEAAQDRLVFVGGALAISVLDSQNETTNVMLSVKPAKECGADAA
jgi:hypothetical protein